VLPLLLRLRIHQEPGISSSGHAENEGRPTAVHDVAKVNFLGLFGARLAKYYPAFFVQVGLLGEAYCPGLDVSALNPPASGLTDAVFTVVSQKHFDFLHFKSELSFAKKSRIVYHFWGRRQQRRLAGYPCNFGRHSGSHSFFQAYHQPHRSPCGSRGF
jgi:hypothetical protein